MFSFEVFWKYRFFKITYMMYNLLMVKENYVIKYNNTLYHDTFGH